MKQICVMLAIALTTVFAFDVCQADQSGQKQLLMSYIQYLKSGNTQGLLSILGNPLLERHKDQLQSNPSYSSFLVKHYDQAQIKILTIDDSGADMSRAHLEVLYPGAAQAHDLKLQLRRLDGNWKIVNELE